MLEKKIPENRTAESTEKFLFGLFLHVAIFPKLLKSAFDCGFSCPLIVHSLGHFIPLLVKFTKFLSLLSVENFKPSQFSKVFNPNSFFEPF